jgi:hypothetical protein
VTDQTARRVIFHGAIVVLLGLLAGFPFAFVILGTMTGDVRAWRMAHLEGLLNGLVMFAVTALSSRLVLSAGRQSLLAGCLIVTGYGNVVASIVAASLNVRGLAAGGSVGNTVVYLLFVVAVVTITLAMVLVALGARRSAAAK